MRIWTLPTTISHTLTHHHFFANQELMMEQSGAVVMLINCKIVSVLV